MMHLYLQRPEDWDRYTQLLLSFEGREAEFGARAALMIQQHLDDGVEAIEAVRRGLDEAERVERALQQRERAEEAAKARIARARQPDTPPSRLNMHPWTRLRPAVALGVAMVVGLVVGVLLPRDPGPTGRGVIYRGVASADAGSIKLWGDALPETPPRQHIGQGNTPRLRIRPGTLFIQWSRPTGTTEISALVFWTDARGARHALQGEAEGFTRLEDVLQVTLPAEAARLLVITYASGDDPRDILDEVGDGRAASDGVGDWQMLAFELEEIP